MDSPECVKSVDDKPLIGYDSVPLDSPSPEGSVDETLADGDSGVIIINETIERIGMGKYQWGLFVLCGFGWLADNMWLQGLAVVMPSFQREFDIPNSLTGFGTSSAMFGMIFGAAGWGLLSDVIGRRPAFNITLLITAIAGALSGLSVNFAMLCTLFAVMGLGVGGNLPVDGALFLEFVPKDSQKLLTLLSLFWPVGQCVAAAIGWALIPRYSCPDGDAPCDPSLNQGWRYTLYAMGCLTFLMFAGRFFVFDMLESPKFYLSRGRRADAAEVMQKLAKANGTTTAVTEEDFPDSKESLNLAQDRMSKFSPQHLKPLFSKQMWLTTTLIWLIWFLVQAGYVIFNGFLPKYLHEMRGPQASGPDTTYRDYLIISVCGIPGSILGMYAVESKIGRRGTMAIATLGTGACFFLFTLSADPSIQLAANCVASVLQNAMYGVLYSYTPEVFSSKYRASAVGIASALARVAGTIVPLITGSLLTLGTKVPLYVSAGIMGGTSILMWFLPVETRGTQAM